MMGAMNRHSTRIRAALFVIAAMIGSAVSALAQCPMCKAAIEGSPDAAAAASGINLAVLVLLVPPVAIFSGVFVLIYKQRNSVS